jgi:hypothetical protein
MGSINRSGLIDALFEEGIELKRETVEDVIGRYNRMAARYAARGWNVDTGLVYLRAVITGIFRSQKFDSAKNSIYVSAVQGLEIRRELANTEVDIMGEAPDVIHIYSVVNLQTRTADGTLTRGYNAEVDGVYIKIAGNDPATGVYLENIDSHEPYKLGMNMIVTNNPRKLLLLIPSDLYTGTYRLKVVTQYSGTNKDLKTPRTVVFGQMLTVL